MMLIAGILLVTGLVAAEEGFWCFADQPHRVILVCRVESDGSHDNMHCSKANNLPKSSQDSSANDMESTRSPLVLAAQDLELSGTLDGGTNELIKSPSSALNNRSQVSEVDPLLNRSLPVGSLMGSIHRVDGLERATTLVGPASEPLEAITSSGKPALMSEATPATNQSKSIGLTVDAPTNRRMLLEPSHTTPDNQSEGPTLLPHSTSPSPLAAFRGFNRQVISESPEVRPEGDNGDKEPAKAPRPSSKSSTALKRLVAYLVKNKSALWNLIQMAPLMYQTMQILPQALAAAAATSDRKDSEAMSTEGKLHQMIPTSELGSLGVSDRSFSEQEQQFLRLMQKMGLTLTQTNFSTAKPDPGPGVYSQVGPSTLPSVLASNPRPTSERVSKRQNVAADLMSSGHPGPNEFKLTGEDVTAKLALDQKTEQLDGLGVDNELWLTKVKLMKELLASMMRRKEFDSVPPLIQSGGNWPFKRVGSAGLS